MRLRPCYGIYTFFGDGERTTNLIRGVQFAVVLHACLHRNTQNTPNFGTQGACDAIMLVMRLVWGGVGRGLDVFW